jgi:hypothetical protein
VGIQTLQFPQLQVVQDFVNKQQIAFALLKDTGHKNEMRYQIDNIPSYVLVDKTGRVVQISDKLPTIEEIEKLLK